MIRCGMALDTDGIWKESQLSVELKNIIAKYRNHFEGEPVVTEAVLNPE